MKQKLLGILIVSQINKELEKKGCSPVGKDQLLTLVDKNLFHKKSELELALQSCLSGVEEFNWEEFSRGQNFIRRWMETVENELVALLPGSEVNSEIVQGLWGDELLELGKINESQLSEAQKYIPQAKSLLKKIKFF